MRPPSCRTDGRRGAAVHAISGVDLALWDLLGKHLDQPVYELLGGLKRKRIRAYASYLFGATPEDTAALGREAQALGLCDALPPTPVPTSAAPPQARGPSLSHALSLGCVAARLPSSGGGRSARTQRSMSPTSPQPGKRSARRSN